MDALLQDIRYAHPPLPAHARLHGRSRFWRWRSASARTPRSSRRQRGAARAAAVPRSRSRSSWCGRPTRGGPGRPNTVGPANFIRWQERATAFESIAAVLRRRASTSPAPASRKSSSRRSSRRTSSRRSASRRCSAARSAPTKVPTATTRRRPELRLWQRRFGGDPSIVGRTIQLNGRTVHRRRRDAGRHVDCSSSAGSLVGKPADVWMPFALHRSAARAARPLHDRDRAAEAGRPADRGAGADATRSRRA